MMGAWMSLSTRKLTPLPKEFFNPGLRTLTKQKLLERLQLQGIFQRVALEWLF